MKNLSSTNFTMFSRELENEYNEKGNNTNYPLEIDPVTGNPTITPLFKSIEDLRKASSDVIIPVDLQNLLGDIDTGDNIKKVTIDTDAIKLDYKKATYWYADPITGSSKKIELPFFPINDPKELYKTTALLGEVFLHFYNLTNISLASDPMVVENQLPGLGLEFFDKICGDSATNPKVLEAIKKGANSSDRASVDKLLTEHDNARSKAAITNFILINKIRKYVDGLKSVNNILSKLSAMKVEDEGIQVAGAAPVIRKKKDGEFNEIKNGKNNSGNRVTLI